MSTILTAIVFVKSVNGSRTLSGTATARLDDDEYVDIQYKAFNVDEANLIDEIQENTICCLQENTYSTNRNYL